jgi:hypothetical protein
MADAALGKTTFKLRVTNRSYPNAAASGLALSIYPLMHMQTMNHSTPIGVITDNGDGTYDCTVYYLMMSGANMGYWELQVKIGSETATFYPAVSMAMGTDTVSTSLYGPADAGMNSMMTGYYRLFNDGIVSAASPTFKLHISHQESMMTTFKAVSLGSVLSSPTRTVTSITVLASTDSAFSSGPTVTATDDGNGRWSMPGMTGLASAGTATVYVKLNVNGQDKTTDGLVSNPSGTNTYATFTVTVTP